MWGNALQEYNFTVQKTIKVHILKKERKKAFFEKRKLSRLRNDDSVRLIKLLMLENASSVVNYIKY